jgi:hypothetical protein
LHGILLAVQDFGTKSCHHREGGCDVFLWLFGLIFSRFAQTSLCSKIVSKIFRNFLKPSVRQGVKDRTSPGFGQSVFGIT